MPFNADIIIIGAGVIGLAVAAEVARENRTVYILERNAGFGRETSSRNSGVIHTGVLSRAGSLNAHLCIAGKSLIYQLCREYSIDHRRTGKILVACDLEDIAALETIYQHKDEGILMEYISKQKLQKLEPAVRGEAALLLPEAGVVDAHALMSCYLGLAACKGAQLICRTEVTGISQSGEGYEIQVREPDGTSNLQAGIVINCAGFNSDKVAAVAGIDIAQEHLQISYFKGEYYSICSAKARRINQRLVYPTLRPGGLVGIHTVLDVDGRVRLGPDFYQVDKIDYAIDDSRRSIFCKGAQRLFPFVEIDDIEPESTGIMPRLYATNEPFVEFYIRHEYEKGLPGFINLVGIESPGLTASPAIAKYVGRIVESILGN